MTGGQAVVECLIKAGIHTVFGLPGVQNDWLYNGFYDYRDKIKVIHSSWIFILGRAVKCKVLRT